MEKYDYLVLSSKKFILQKEYWIDNLCDIENVDSLLEYDYLECTKNEKEMAIVDFNLDKNLTSTIERITKNSDINIFTLLVSAFACTLYKYKEWSNICIPVPRYREHKGSNEIINKNVILNYSLTETMNFKDILIQGKNIIIEGYKNQDYPIENILSELEHETKKRYSILLENMFIYKNIHNFSVEDYNDKNLVLTCFKIDNVIKFQLMANKNIYDFKRIESLANHYNTMLRNLLNNPNQSIGEMDILMEQGIDELVNKFNNTNFRYPKSISINKIFEDRVKETPNKIAVIHNGETITYKELNSKANKLARFILKNRKVENEIIGVMAERSISTIIAVLGILKSRCTCLTVDYSFPKERINYILNNSSVKLVLTQSHIKDKIYDSVSAEERDTRQLVSIDDERICNEEDYDLEEAVNDELIANIIYTSGSTGNPKGVMLKHENIVNILYNLDRVYPLLDDDVFLFKTNYTFDASISEIYGWFVGKGSLAILDNDDHKEPKKILNAILKYNVTHITFVPTMFEAFANIIISCGVKSLNKLKYIFIGGEVLSSEIVKNFYHHIKDVQVINLYGPTETTIYATSFPVAIDEDIYKLPIGKPMDNVCIYILNNKMKLQPVGVTGEIYIGGKGVSFGYVNNDTLTNERYIDNPYIPGEKMYKTGDLARWRIDGNIEYIGRIDHQIKLRGLRIELGEIENIIKTYEDITQAVVTVKGDKNKGQYLCGYVVGNKSINMKNLKEYLYDKLPIYMVPSYTIQIDKFSYTRSGKIDMLSLPEIGNSFEENKEFQEPTNELEKEVSMIWKEVLGEPMIGIDDNFFDLGGNSLNAIEILSKILTKFNTEISIMKFFELKTVREVCNYINSSEKTIYSSMKAIKEQPFYLASSAQKRIYALNGINKNNINYNMPEVMIINGSIDKEKINKIFKELIKRHEAFRTYFEFKDNNLIQVIDKHIDFSLDFMDFEEAYMDIIINNFIRPFDLSKAPLMRVLLVRVDKDKHYLLIDMHHIISDGTSMGIIINEFIKLYQEEELENLTIQYKEFSHWQSEFIQSENFKKQEEFWLNMFSGEIPVLELPTDFPRQNEKLYGGSTLTFELDKELVSEIKKLAAQRSVTPYIFLLSTYYIVLNKYTSQEDIVVGYPVVGRPLPELNEVVGMFVNTVAMRHAIDNEKTFINFLDEVKDKVLKIYENQDYQFDTLVEKLNLKRSSNRNALFDTMFSLRDTYFSEITFEGCSFSKYKFETKQTKFDLYFNVEDYSDKILLEMTYRTDLFKKESMERFNNHFKNIIEKVINDPYIKIADIEMISESEKQKIFKDINLINNQYPRTSNIIEQFEIQVENNPEAVALEFGENKLTYRELNQKANQIAKMIVSKNIDKGSIVAMLCERSFEMIAGIMGILKAGCAYLPIDIDYPRDRANYLIKDSNSKLLLSNLDISNLDLDSSCEVLNLYDEEIQKFSTSNLNLNINNDDLAYVIYTSGTSGNPKGVLINHSNVLCRTINSKYCEINEKDKVLQLSNYAFDGSVFDIFISLLNGAALVLIAKRDILDMDKLGKVIENSNISFVFITTALFNLITDVNVQCLKNIRKIYVGGEKLKVRYLKKAFEVTGTGKIINIYGPSEATIYATCFEVNSLEDCENDVPIGKAASNTQIYICDKYGKILPFGVAGEICICGDGVGKGYLNADKLQSIKFIPSINDDKNIMYRTGDLGKMLPDGNILFIGRIDNQVKLRGYRIELDEIESIILTYEGIKECVVLVNKDKNDNNHLCAYLVVNNEIDINKLNIYLKNKIPQYMIPTEFIILEKMMLTLNGKIDRNSLKNIDNVHTNENKKDCKLLDDLEMKILNIWTDILGTNEIGIYDNFFECGGNSLLAVKVEVEMKKIGLKIEVEDIYKYQTINDLSQFIKSFEVKK